eukprot:c25182_g1_i1 orf=637-2685(-)
MQASGQYGVPEVPQYILGRGAPPHGHMFNVPHDISLSSTSGHSHPNSHSPNPQHLPQQYQHHQYHHGQHQQKHFQHTEQSQVLPQQQRLPSHQQQLCQPPPMQAPQQQQNQAQQHQQNQQSQQYSQQTEQQHMAQQLGLPSASDSPETPSPVACRPSPGTTFSKALLPVDDQSIAASEEHEGLIEDGEKGSIGNRWPRQETLALLQIRADMDAHFRDSSLKAPLWEDVSRKMGEMGYTRSAKKCKEKFENVHKYYRRTMDGKAGRQDGKCYRFFSQLEALSGRSDSRNDTTNANVTNVVSRGDNGKSCFGSNNHLGGSNNRQGDRGGFPSTEGTVSGRISNGSEHKLELDYSSGLNFSSDSSEDDYEDPVRSEILERRKRRRSTPRKFMVFFENLMKMIMDKQEQMQQKFLETLERRENDRVIREEAWKRQEMARASREQELRAQERALAATRDAALVAFLQKVTGQTLQLPDVAIPAQPVSAVPDVHEDYCNEREQFLDPNNKRWPKSEVLALINLRSGMDSRFHESGPKGPLWEEISCQMATLGYSRSAKRCKEKWENINKYFKKARESNKKRPENSKTCPYFHQLDTLYSKGLLGGHKHLLHKTESQPDDLLEQPSGSNKEDSGHVQGADSEMLAIIPSDENGTVGTSTSNVVATQFFSSPENGNSAGDQGMNKGTPSP